MARGACPGGRRVSHLGQDEDLARVDEVGVADAVAVGLEDADVHQGLPVAVARDGPERVAGLDDAQRVAVAGAGGLGQGGLDASRRSRWKGDSMRLATVPSAAIWSMRSV
jgi:hypothetical protein